MLIPGLNYKLAIRFCQLLGLTKFLELEARRFTELDIPLDVKDRFAAAFPHCAPPGFDALGNGVAMTIVLGTLFVMAVVGYFAIRDLYRFGRDGLPWLVAVVAFLVFASGGYWLAGLTGSIAGVPLVIAFAIERRHKALKRS